MSHQIYRIVTFDIIKPYTLRIKFDDDMERIINFRPVLEGSLFGPLQDETEFNQVEINPELHTLVWPDGADFDPETLHEWPKYEEEMQRMASQWAKAKLKVA
jgi:hypothetical protein